MIIGPPPIGETRPDPGLICVHGGTGRHKESLDIVLYLGADAVIDTRKPTTSSGKLF